MIELRYRLRVFQEDLERTTGIAVAHWRAGALLDPVAPSRLVFWKPWGSLSWAELAGVRVGFQARLGTHVVTAAWIDWTATTDLSGGYHPRPWRERLLNRVTPFRTEKAVPDDDAAAA